MRDDEGVGGPDDPGRDDTSPDSPDSDDHAPARSGSRGDAAGGADGDSGSVREGTSQPADGGIVDGEARSTTGREADGRGTSGSRLRGEADREHPPSPRDSTAEDTDGPGWLLYAYDLVSSVAVVVLIGGLLFAASGVWPPMVAVQSGSMQPTMERGDLVYVMEADRFPGEGAHGETGVVTAERGRETGYEKFGGYGDVIVYKPDGSEQQTPIIHRAMLWVEDGERWVDRANPAYLGGADSCSDLPDICPAPHAGFITKGDANGGYDQVSGIADEPVKPKWVIGTAELHVPYLGQIRLGSSTVAGNGSATMPSDRADVTVTASGPAPNARPAP